MRWVAILAVVAGTHVVLPPGTARAADDPGEARALDREAVELLRKGRYDAALSLAQKGLALREAAHSAEHADVATSLNTLGEIYEAKGQPAEALALYERSLAIREKLLGPAHRDVAESLHNIASVYQGRARFAEALTRYQRSLAIYESALGPEHEDVAQSLNNLATVHEAMGRHDEALRLFQRSLAIREKVLGDDSTAVAESLNNLAVVYRASGRYAEALPRYRRSLEIYEKTLGPEHQEVATLLNNLASLYQAMGEYGEALPRFQRSLAIREAALGPDHFLVAQSLNNLAFQYQTMGQYAAALPLLQRSLAITEKVYGRGHPSVAVSLTNLAALHQAKGEYAEALTHYERSLAIREQALGPEHPAVAQSLNNLGDLHRAMGRYEEALPRLRRSLAIREKALGPEHPAVAQSLGNLGLLYYDMGRYADAAQPLQRAERIATANGYRDILWRAQARLGRVNAKLGEPALGVFWGKQAVNTLQGLRAGLVSLDRDLQRSYLQDKRTVYTDLADLLIDAGRLVEAQRVMAMLKDEEFFDFVRRDAAADPRTGEVPLTGVERAAHERFYAVREQLAGLTAERADLDRRQQLGLLGPGDQARLSAIEADLVAARVAFDAFVNGLAKLLVAEAVPRADALTGQIESHQNVLADLGAAGVGVAAVQFVVSERRVHVIVSTPGGQVAHEVVLAQAELNHKVAAFRVALQDQRVDYRPLARELHELLIAPIAKHLAEQKIHTLMLYLDGSLRYLPFAALMDGDAYLIERYRLAIYTDAAKSRLAADRQPQWRVAAWGVTRAFPEQNFAALPAVRDELAGIVSPDVLPGVALLDDEFTYPALRAGLGNPVLHIASHFRFVPGSEASFLLLGDGSRLTLRQIRTELPRFVNVDLLTLSACETALGGGQNESGFEVEGLGVLAQKHGAKAVLATLWPVADASTAALMQRFYRVGRRPEQSKAEALRQAQLAIMRGTDAARDASDGSAPYAHPYHWAPFILMGNWL